MDIYYDLNVQGDSIKFKVWHPLIRMLSIQIDLSSNWRMSMRATAFSWQSGDLKLMKND